MGELMLIAGALAWAVLLAWRVNVALNQMRRVADRKHEVHYYEQVIIVEVEGPLDEDDDIVLDFGGDPFWN